MRSGLTEGYLRRIGSENLTEPTAEALFALHRAHLLSVPFENLDIHLGRRIVLDEMALFDKIVHWRRGGFCYELNGLFHILLQEIGFRVTLLNAIIPEQLNGCGLPFDHPVLLVELNGRWLLDVGFGDAFRVPLRLEDGVEQEGAGSAYRLSAKGDLWELSERAISGEWELQYSFTLRPCALDNFSEACRYYETSPKSTFTRKRICSRATSQGSISLTDRRLIVSEGREKRDQTLADEAEFVRALQDHFGIALDAPFRSHTA
jgi:N-hydroxyarylamine O-acetyltransferase